MPKYKYLEISNKIDYLNNLKNLLEFHKIHYASSELNSYTKKELKYLTHKFKIRFRNIDNKTNYWYRTSSIY
jgi:hypothetical protein